MLPVNSIDLEIHCTKIKLPKNIKIAQFDALSISLGISGVWTVQWTMPRLVWVITFAQNTSGGVHSRSGVDSLTLECFSFKLLKISTRNLNYNCSFRCDHFSDNFYMLVTKSLCSWHFWILVLDAIVGTYLELVIKVVEFVTNSIGTIHYVTNTNLAPNFLKYSNYLTLNWLIAHLTRMPL